MPVAEFSGKRGWGYDGVDLFAPHHSYGGPEELKHFVNACHELGLAVILDVVYNHLGPSGNYLPQFGPYFTDRHSTPWGPAINFDGAGSDEVRRFFCDNALMWLCDYHFDGLRLDAIHSIIDTSALHFLEQLSCEVSDLQAKIGRHLVLIAESDLNDPRIIRPHEIGGYGINAQWNDDFHHALHTVLTGEKAGYYVDYQSQAALAKAFERGFVYDYRYSTFRRRHHGRPRALISGHSIIAYVQNHDQIGNRAQGKRSAHLMNVERLKIAAALVLTSPFVPMLFQGEEWGAKSPFQYFTNHEDLELGRCVTEGRRKEFAAFGWDSEAVPDPQARETFERSKLDWNERFQESQGEILAWHRDLIALRRENPGLSDGRLDRVRVSFDESANWLVVQRNGVVVACNLNSITQNVRAAVTPESKLLLTSNSDVEVTEGTVKLRPDSVAIFRTKESFRGAAPAALK